MKKREIYKLIITVLIFWILDFTLHFTGVGETNYYYISKLANSTLFAFLWFSLYNKKEHSKKLLFAFIFSTWISAYYLVSSYSGLVQFLGVYARYTPPAFVIFGKVLHPFFWWIYHGLAFFLGLEISSLVKK